MSPMYHYTVDFIPLLCPAVELPSEVTATGVCSQNFSLEGISISYAKIFLERNDSCNTSSIELLQTCLVFTLNFNNLFETLKIIVGINFITATV